MGFWRRLFSPLPLFDWVQVEATTRCNARCSYCPRTWAGDLWPDADLDQELFRRILPQLSTRHVHLQGWGEPFLHPGLLDMVRAAKAAGFAAGTTSNGLLLDRAMAEAVAESGLDVLALSLAGTGERNDALRRGVPQDKVLAALDELSRAKARSGTDKPAVNLAYLLLRSDRADLESLPRLLSGRGVSQVVVSTLDLVPDPSLAREALAPAGDEERAALSSRLERAALEFHKAGLALHYRLPGPSRLPGCPENPGQALVVDVAGRVSPCVFTALPPDTRHPGASRSLCFGGLDRASLAEIWTSRDYSAFREAFEAGHPDGPCQGCLKPYLD